MISHSSVYTFEDNKTHRFDVFINSIGYEERAAALVRAGRVSADCFISLSFEENEVLSFAENKKVMDRMSALIVTDVSDFFRTKFRSLIFEKYTIASRSLSVGIDVSSMNRTMSALALSTMFACKDYIGEFEILYVPAKFSEPTLTFTPIDQVGAVTPELSGFDSEPALPVALILGLGYEYGTAVGLINQLEPNFTLCLRATGGDEKYAEAVRAANLQFDFNPYNVEITEYELFDVKAAYEHIENIVYSLVTSYRVVLVPMGPKILAALLVLISLKYFGRVAVWRVARPGQAGQVIPEKAYMGAHVRTIDAISEKNTRLLREMLEMGQLS
ncbi:hypothetical protein [Bradyrhizobium sp. LHD-71]|uniref:hypothetical protein n=1 Tax=Bradyrhizobium sp. LHD-71 TaxID=3072141 RepID=UPI00280CEC86|nr:hypothetical protein [Bradyrhizobium sp. LHD-71]MDQ8732445.1 hypothetical protein [Bradyrhizobium sp. LHD-71]